MRKLAFAGPFFLQLILTNNCNLNCLHCYRPDNAGGEFPKEAFPLLGEQYQKILKYTAAPRGRVEISGGEPLLAQGLKPLLQTLNRGNVPCRIFTNGTLVTKEYIGELKGLGLRQVQISLEGHEDLHDTIRGEGSFYKSCRAAAWLCQAGMEVTLSTTLTRLNYKSIESVARVGSKISHRLFFSRLVPLGQGEGLARELLSKIQWFEAMRAIFRQRRGKAVLAFRDPTWVGFFMPRHLAPTEAVISGCAAGYHGLAVDSDGTVYPCRRLPLAVGNIFQDDITEVWHHPVMENLRNRDGLKGKCGVCEYRWHCGGCRGIAYALTRDYLEEDFQCPWN